MASYLKPVVAEPAVDQSKIKLQFLITAYLPAIPRMLPYGPASLVTVRPSRVILWALSPIPIAELAVPVYLKTGCSLGHALNVIGPLV